jgi:hypothetical protein
VINASLKLLDWLCDISSLIILYVTVVVIFVQVICRYVLQVALPWMEFARYAYRLIFLANTCRTAKEHSGGYFERPPGGSVYSGRRDPVFTSSFGCLDAACSSKCKNGDLTVMQLLD